MSYLVEDTDDDGWYNRDERYDQQIVKMKSRVQSFPTEFHVKFEFWNALPEKVKMECIKLLDFKTKCQLRSTSKTEKKLADSVKYSFDKFWYFDEEFRMANIVRREGIEYCSEGYSIQPSYRRHSFIHSFLLKNCQFKEGFMRIGEDIKFENTAPVIVPISMVNPPGEIPILTMANSLKNNKRIPPIQMEVEPSFEYWPLLPPEVKKVCINSMDFKTRCQIRGTAQTEKALTDSLLYNFDRIRVDEESVEITNIWKKENEEILTEAYKMKPTDERLLPIIHYILKHCQFKEGNLDPIETSISPIFESLTPGSIRIENVKVFDYEGKVTNILGKFASGINKMIIVYNTDPVNELYKIPMIVSAKAIMIYGSGSCSQNIVERWLEMDKDIGCRFEFELWAEVIEEQLGKFEERKVSIYGGILRLRMDNPDKHLILFRNNQYRRDKLCGAVIRADCKESEYVNYTNVHELGREEWIL